MFCLMVDAGLTSSLISLLYSHLSLFPFLALLSQSTVEPLCSDHLGRYIELVPVAGDHAGDIQLTR